MHPPCPACGHWHEGESPAADSWQPAQDDRPLWPATPPVAPPPQFAGFWVRVVAALTDIVLVTFLQGAFALLLAGATYLLSGSVGGDNTLVAGVLTFAGMFVGVAYYVFFTGYCGQTPGKMAIRVKVVRSDGSEVGYLRAFVREIPGKFLSGVLLGIGYLLVAFDARKQGLHDKIADTLVVKI